MQCPSRVLACVVLGLCWASEVARAADDSRTVVEALRQADANVFPAEKRPELARLLGDSLAARRRSANERSTADWKKVDGAAAWDLFVRERLAPLQPKTTPPERLNIRVTKQLDGDGVRIECLAFESRPGLWVTANLYLPHEPRPSMPGILICHSHHNPKTEGELQDMGVNWARLGCLVLVMDQIGHGERRVHPFASEKDYPKPFRTGRQDYWFRYNTGMQLDLVGESLAGWMAWDLMRGVDLLLSRPGVDAKRIILLGAVAGGGDPAALAAALDPRIACVAPFNFGGPQPESRYPLPDDAESSFNYGGSGSWESTRNLRGSLSGGYLPWVIVGSIAPRRLIYSHEFSWDRQHDPVWRRLEQIYAWKEAPKNLAFAHGTGVLSGKPPEASHCNNIGEVHRKMIYPALEQWFGIPKPDPEVRARRPAADLWCLTPPVDPPVRLTPVHALARDIAEKRLAAVRTGGKPAAPRLIEEARAGSVTVRAGGPEPAKLANVRLERLALERAEEPGLVIPLALLIPQRAGDAGRAPVVLALSQRGKEVFLKQHAESIGALLAGGAAVCLADVRGTGELRPGDDRGRNSAAASLSASEEMLGGTLLEARLRDVQAVRSYLAGRQELDVERLALWGASLVEPNPPEREVRVPHDVDSPVIGEPLGGLLVVLTASSVPARAVLAEGCLVSWLSVLDSPFVHVPHDALDARAFQHGDLDDATAALAARATSVRLVRPINGRHQAVTREELTAAYPLARSAFSAAGRENRLTLEVAPPDQAETARWLLEALR